MTRSAFACVVALAAGMAVLAAALRERALAQAQTEPPPNQPTPSAEGAQNDVPKSQAPSGATPNADQAQSAGTYKPAAGQPSVPSKPSGSGNSSPQSGQAKPGDEQKGGKTGAGASGTHTTGVTGTSAAGSHHNVVFKAPDAKAAVPPRAAPPFGDPNAGSDVAVHGMTDKGAPPCVSCHGVNGEGNMATGFPRLAGMPYEYLRKQLDDYASGRRVQPIMTPIARALDPAQRRDVAAYYSDVPPSNAGSNAAAAGSPAATQAAQSADARRRAQALATVGDANLRVQGCANCHGPGGIGLRPSYPPLAGQNAAYLASALNEWRDGTRRNDASGAMASVARSLSASDVAALAAMYASLPPATLSR